MLLRSRSLNKPPCNDRVPVRDHYLVRRLSGPTAYITMLIMILSSACTGGINQDPTPTPPPEPIQQSVEDRQTAEQALPTSADFDSSFSASPFEPRNAPEEDSALNNCLGLGPTAVHETARAYSPIFTSGAGTRIQFSITFADSEQKAGSDLAGYMQEGAGECVRQSFLRQLERTGNPTGVAQSRIAPAPGGEEASAFRLVLQPESSAPRIVDLVTAVRGRAEITATFINVQDPVTEQEEDRLIRLCLDRLGG